MSLKKIKNFFRWLFYLMPVILLGFVVWQYISSSSLKTKADQLLTKDRPQTAILLYQQAQSAFPLRTDIEPSLRRAKIILQQELKFEDSAQSVADLPSGQVAVPTSVPLIPFLRKSLPTPIIPPVQVSVPILMYHHIEINPRPGNSLWAALYVSPFQLDQQLAYLSAHGYHVVSLDDIYNALQGTGILPEKPVALTFDDGYASFYLNGFPILKKYFMKATEFIITTYQTNSAYFTWSQIQEMDNSGLITFGAHTKDHPDLAKISTKFLTQEIKGSKDDLELHLKKTVHWFAYPYGSYNVNVVKSVQTAGYLGAVSTNYGNIETLTGLYLMPRIMIDGRFSLSTFAQKLQ